jgi:L-glyceraldehyde 3-phosphate reductase
MQYREMGNTGLRLSVIGFGAGDNAGLFSAPTPGIDKPAPFEEQVRVMARALELGINYVDTAAGYGDNNSENNLGKVFKELKVHPIINSKVELVTDGLDDVAGFVERSVDASLKRLGIDYLDVVQIHNSMVFHRPENARTGPTGPWLPLEVPEYMGPKGVLEGLYRIRKAGKARFTGFAGGASGPLAKAIIASGQISLINVGFNLMNPGAGVPQWTGRPGEEGEDEDIISYAHAHGIGCAIINPLQGGVLTDNAVNGGPPHPLARDNNKRDPDGYAKLLSRARQFQFLSIEGRSLAQATTQFILRHPGVTTALGGFTSAEQVEDRCAALTAPPLTDEELAKIELIWRSNFGEM